MVEIGVVGFIAKVVPNTLSAAAEIGVDHDVL